MVAHSESKKMRAADLQMMTVLCVIFPSPLHHSIINCHKNRTCPRSHIRLHPIMLTSTTYSRAMHWHVVPTRWSLSRALMANPWPKPAYWVRHNEICDFHWRLEFHWRLFFISYFLTLLSPLSKIIMLHRQSLLWDCYSHYFNFSENEGGAIG